MTHASTSKPNVRRSRSKVSRKPTAADGDARSRRAQPVARKGKREGKDESKAAKLPKADKPRLPGRMPVRLPVIGESNGLANAHRRGKPSCTACGLCCSYVAIEIDSPATVKAATQMLWYVYHENVSLYVNDDEWMVQFDTTCVHLQPDYRCGIYHTRPHICREFSEQDCEVNTGDDGHTFYTADEFLAYLKQTRPRVHAFVRKHFSPPEAAPRTHKEPFERRFAAVMSRRQALGV